MKRTLSLEMTLGFVVLGVLLLVRAADGQARYSSSASLDVVISEVAWGGTAASSYDEWIELYNNTGLPVALNDWTLSTADDSPSVVLSGTLPAHGYYLLERTDDCTVSDVTADQLYTGNLSNTGERLELRDDGGLLVDSADGAGGWPAGSGSPDYFTMERIDPAQPDAPSNWASNDGLVRNGLDCDGNPLNGTPKARNSATPLPGADLRVAKHGPATAQPGQTLTYTIRLSNAGQLAAADTRLTDVLPAQVQLLAQTAPYPLSQPTTGTLVWDVGSLPTTTAALPVTFTVTARVDAGAYGELTNVLTATSATTEVNPADNADRVMTTVGGQPATAVVLIEAVYYDAYEPLDADEGFRLINVSTATAQLDGWRVTDGEAEAVFPPGTTLAPGDAIWCTREAAAFSRQFGFDADFEYGDDTDPAVPDMSGGVPRFGDDDECRLLDAEGQPVDTLVYEGGDTTVAGWSGPAVEPWTSGGSFAAEGQILYRKRDLSTGKPVADTDTAADWAQDPADQVDGRKVLYPGWDLDAFFFTERVTETATLTVAVTPDNAYDVIAGALAGAQQSIQIETYSFRSRELADLLLDRLGQGVSVTLLLEGAPAFEGVTDEEKWIARQLHDAGAQVLFMVNDTEADVHDRYSNQHAKLVVVDGQVALVGSENLTETSLPADDKANGTAGRRGVYLATNAPGVVSHLQAVFAADADPAHHTDVAGCDRVPDLCGPPPGFEPAPTPDWLTYTVQFPAPLVAQGTFAFEVVQSPENSLRTAGGLLGLLGRAGPGDTVLVQQFYEHRHWGPSTGTPQADPNLRLEAYVAAARRGATVRVLLDRHFDQGGDNAETVAHLRSIARDEGLDLQARLGDPTSLGLHNKMVLVHAGGRGYVHAGSINGSEASSKVNRELALQVRSDAAYDYLQAVFEADWQASTPPVYLPAVFRGYAPPPVADHVLISEVYYPTIPEKEWVEIYNPTGQAVDLSAYKIGDAVYFDDAEGMFQFPPGTSLGPGQVLVVAATATGFREQFPYRSPDFEIVDSDPAVPDLLDYPAWGTWEWGLSNAGDEVLLLDGDDAIVDAVVYGEGAVPGVVPHPGVEFGHSLERFPIWLDTDDCSADFRDWPYPSPGEMP